MLRKHAGSKEQGFELRNFLFLFYETKKVDDFSDWWDRHAPVIVTKMRVPTVIWTNRDRICSQFKLHGCEGI